MVICSLSGGSSRSFSFGGHLLQFFDFFLDHIIFDFGEEDLRFRKACPDGKQRRDRLHPIWLGKERCSKSEHFPDFFRCFRDDREMK